MQTKKISRIHLGAFSGLAVWRSRPIRYLVLCGLLLIAAIVVSTSIMVDNLRDSALFDSERELKNTALILAEQIDRSFQAVDLVQSNVINKIKTLGITSSEDFGRRMSGEDVHEMLKTSISGTVQAYNISLINADGRVLNLSLSWPVPPIDVHDQEFFNALKSNPLMTSYISLPRRNRTNGTWTLLLGRKITGANGEFLGLVLGAVELSYFEKLFSAVSLGEGSSITLFRSDGALLTRFPQIESIIGKTFKFSVNAALGDGNSGTVRFIGEMAGKDRLLAARGLAHFPIVISAAVDTAAALAIWQKQTNILIGAGGLAALTVAIMIFLIVRQLAKAHSSSLQSLALEKHRLDTALNNMGQGLIMFDSADRFVVCNDHYIEMYGLSREIVKPGFSFDDLLRHRTKAGEFVHHDIDRYRADLAAAMAQGQVMSSVLETADGREILVTNSPMSAGGRVATHKDVTERRKTEAKIAYMAQHDALTDLPNRSMLYEQLRQMLASKRGEHSAVFCLDLDHFKDVNDAHGHSVGDLLLKSVADRLRQCVRDADIVARLGGDEFAIMQVAASQPTDATSLASRLIEVIGAPYQLGGHQVVVELSIGIALAPDDGQDPEQLLRNADLALYRAKSDGRGLYRFFEPEMDARMQARRRLEIDLRKAIANGEFELFYQPLVTMRTERITGFEALIRWNHPERGLIPPLDFITVAEETGLIVPIGEWVLRQACAEAAAWPREMKIAVNLSPVQFKNKSLLASVISALTASGLSPTRLELEITESVLLQEADATLAILHELRGLGVRISMDDFGTGYSSLSYLRKFPFDRIKIDQSFIFDMSDDGDSLAIIRAVIAMGSSLGIATTAEGVETREQFKQLKLEGCTEVQGYLFSPPRPAADVKGLLASINPALKAIA